MKKTLVILGMSLMMSAPSFAAQKKHSTATNNDKTFTRNYGMAGCGLGSMVMGKDGNQIFAGTTNGTLANQSFAITFGTSNCIDSSTDQVATRMDRFVVVNETALAGDIARGQGEALTSLSSIMHCSDSAELGSALQHHYSVIFPKANVAPRDVTDAIITVVANDRSLALSCRTII